MPDLTCYAPTSVGPLGRLRDLADANRGGSVPAAAILAHLDEEDARQREIARRAFEAGEDL